MEKALYTLNTLLLSLLLLLLSILFLLLILFILFLLLDVHWISMSCPRRLARKLKSERWRRKWFLFQREHPIDGELIDCRWWLPSAVAMATATSMSRFNYLRCDEKFLTADPSDRSRAEVMFGTLVLGSGQTSGINDCNLLHNSNKKVAQLTVTLIYTSINYN